MAGISPRTVVEYTFFAALAFVLFGNSLLSDYLPWLSSSSSVPKSDQHDFRRTSGEQLIDLSLLQEDLLLPSSNLDCPTHHYNTTIVSRNPLIIYIHNFITQPELAQLLDLADTSGYETSPIYSSEKKEKSIDTSIRHSSRSRLPSSSSLIQCLTHRALHFQGFPADTFIEPLWAQKYAPGGHYKHHFDWAGSIRARGGGRVSTFMVYLACEDCVGGGTEFPRIPSPAEGKGKDDFWCDKLDCTADSAQGTVFNPVAGNAVYWENVDSEGNSYDSLWHAGLPVEEGTKIGLNVWSWYQPGLLAALKQRDAGENVKGEA